jgi:putative Mn2+ efflux pump MntP
MDLMILFIALGLAIDSFSVSVANGLASKTFKISKALTISIFFGFFQAIMPVIGWVAGESVADLIAGFDHWIAFGLLTFIGVKMIYESTKNESNRFINSHNVKMLLVLSIATSIDALAVGLSLTFLGISVLFPAIVIGIVTFLLSFLGVLIGDKFGEILKNKVEILGGLILIIIGLKILLEHTGVI